MEEALANFPYWNPGTILAYAGPFFFVTVMMEWWGVRKGMLGGRYEFKDAWASLAMGTGNLISGFLLGFIGTAYMLWVWNLPFRTLDWGFSVWAVIAAVFAQDFSYYINHFLYHKVRWFWASHVIHHSSEHYNLSTAYWIHTEAIDKMPRWFEAAMNTPSHHRVHHATNPRYLDANFAGMFIIWDKMFGTFVPELDEEDIRYGIINMFKDAVSPGLKLSERFKYLFKAPGYSHDGSRKNSGDIKRAYVADNPDQAGTPGLPGIINR